MYSIQVHKRVNQITKLFYQLGLWSSGDEPTVKETRIKLFYSFYYLLFPISCMTGSFSSDNKDDSILLMEAAVISIVLLVQLWYIICRKKEILEMLNRIGVYSIESHEIFTLINEKLERFMKFVTIFISSVYFFTFCIILVVPFLGSEKKLFFNVGFPLDYENNDFGYWIAFVFVATQCIFSAIVFLFSLLMWYLMINCSLRYQVLGYQIKNMGVTTTVNVASNKRKISVIEKQNVFLQDFFASIESHKCIKELTNQVDSFLYETFLVQLVIGGLCICFSTYCLVFNSSENFIEHLILLEILIYSVFIIFMVMYFGNEIKLSSDQLSYCLFEADWIDQPQSTKKKMIIFGELLRQPHELVVLTLYPLTLETFRRILNSAYNMFNILKNLK